MTTYKITNGVWTGLINFSSIEDAQAWATNKGVGYTVSLSDEQVDDSEIIVDKTDRDFEFGQKLLRLFVVDNRKFEKNNNTVITKAQTKQLISDYKDLIDLCAVGAIKELAEELVGITTNAIFTQERKDNYLSLVNEYLNQS